MASEKGMKFDGGKPRYELIPWEAVDQVAWVLTFGAEKYEEDNWQRVPSGVKRYLGSAFRHLTDHAKGELLDPQSKMPHLAHAGCCVLFLLWLLRDQLPKSYDLSRVREEFEKDRVKYLIDGKMAGGFDPKRFVERLKKK